MANHPSAEKRHRQSLKRKARNKIIRSKSRTLLKGALSSIKSKSENTLESVVAAESYLQSAATKGIFDKKNVARRISNLRKKFNSSLQAQ
jgi:small subunit ribosomal protein S20